MNANLRWILPLLLCLAPAASCICAAAADQLETINLDSTRSRADFEVKVMWLIGLHGQFGAVEGTLIIDHFNSSAVVDARINANHLRMRNHSYEAWAKSAEFFDAEHYPQIGFVSSSFPLARLDTGGEIDGTLTIRGISRQATFRVDPPDCENPGTGTCPVVATGTIRRSEFGMHSRRGALSDKVELDLSIYVAAPAASAQ